MLASFVLKRGRMVTQESSLPASMVTRMHFLSFFATWLCCVVTNVSETTCCSCTDCPYSRGRWFRRPAMTSCTMAALCARSASIATRWKRTFFFSLSAMCPPRDAIAASACFSSFSYAFCDAYLSTGITRKRQEAKSEGPSSWCNKQVEESERNKSSSRE